MLLMLSMKNTSFPTALLQMSHVFLRRLCKWLWHCFGTASACAAGVQRERRGGTKEKRPEFVPFQIHIN